MGDLSSDFLAKLEKLRSDISNISIPKSFKNVQLNGNMALNLVRFSLDIIHSSEIFYIDKCYDFMHAKQL